MALEVLAMKLQRRPALAPLAGLASVVLLSTVLPGCRGYYPSWHYAPAAEVHELHLRDGAAETGDASASIIVTARIVGILRPAGSGAPRRLHSRFEIENRSGQPATFDPTKARAAPSGATSLEAEPAPAVAFAAGEQRRVDVFFELPHPGVVPNTSLTEIELTWSIETAGRSLASRATFRRASYGYSYPYYGYGYGYGPYGYDPYWYDPFWVGGSYYRYGPGWHMHTGISIHDCD